VSFHPLAGVLYGPLATCTAGELPHGNIRQRFFLGNIGRLLSGRMEVVGIVWNRLIVNTITSGRANEIAVHWRNVFLFSTQRYSFH
jgi:hypothetical protein